MSSPWLADITRPYPDSPTDSYFLKAMCAIRVAGQVVHSFYPNVSELAEAFVLHQLLMGLSDEALVAVMRRTETELGRADRDALLDFSSDMEKRLDDCQFDYCCSTYLDSETRATLTRVADTFRPERTVYLPPSSNGAGWGCSCCGYT